MIDVAQKTWYVYLLCDPDTEIPFYVGKGTGNRMKAHEYISSDRNRAKQEVIYQIKSEGKQIRKKKIAEFTNEQDALIYEWAMINLYHEHITNIRPGGGKIQPVGNPVRRASRRYTDEDEYQPMLQVSDDLGWSRSKLQQAMKKLNIKGQRFRFHHNTYIATSDVKRLRMYKPRMGKPPRTAS